MDTNEKKKSQRIIQTTIVTLVALLLGAGTIWALQFIEEPSSTRQNADQHKTALSAQADSQYDQANKLLKNGDKTGAKKAFEKARDLYQQTGDTQHLKDIDLSLSLIQHTKDEPTAPPQAPPSIQERN